MIFYLSTQHDPYTLEPYLQERGKHWQNRIKIIHYEHIGRFNGLPVGTYIFTDFDRLGANQLNVVKHLHDHLSKQRPDLQLLNNPNQFVGRFDLLRTLYEQGKNNFNVYRYDELDQEIRFPVFIRLERDHMGSRSVLIENRNDLNQAVVDALMSGAAPDNLMIVEFEDCRQEDGDVRKYSALRWGGYYAARSIIINSDWMQKVQPQKGIPYPAGKVAEEDKYLRTNPHLNQVRSVFEIANIQYGRIDYGVKDGQIQVWEINTNPRCFTPIDKQIPERMHFDDLLSKRFDEGWNLIDCPHPLHPPIPFQVNQSMFNPPVVAV